MAFYRRLIADNETGRTSTSPVASIEEAAAIITMFNDRLMARGAGATPWGQLIPKRRNWCFALSKSARPEGDAGSGGCTTLFCLSPAIDEEALKDGLRAEGRNARQFADALAEAKALKISIRMPGALVLGCDQTLELDDGEMLDKGGGGCCCRDPRACLAPHTEKLHSAAVIWVRMGACLAADRKRNPCSVRALSDAFIASISMPIGRIAVGAWGAIESRDRGLAVHRDQGHPFRDSGLPLLGLLDFWRGSRRCGVRATPSHTPK